MMRMLLPVLLISVGGCRQQLPGTTLDDDTLAGDDDSGGDDDAGPDDDSAGDDDTAGPVAAPDPGPPAFPETISTLSVAIRTGSGNFDGTDNNTLSLCLSADRCFSLNVADVDDFRVGEFDVFHWEGIGLPRAAVDRVQIRSTSGQDMWRPSCAQIQFDGEPVYCQDGLESLSFGNGGGELSSWVDPQGLHLGCGSCYPAPLTHGPMLGAPDAAGGRVWVRTDATRQVALRVGVSQDLTDAPVVAWAYPSPLDDYAATLSQLGPWTADTTYWYRIEIDGVPMGPAQPMQTAPTTMAPSTLRFAFGSCSAHAAQPVFSAIADDAPDLFLFIGDNHYGNTADRDALRWNYRWALQRPARAALAASTHVAAVWDDHDYVGNNTDGFAPGRDTALRVFSEYWANPSFGTESVPGVFSSFQWGDIAFFLLDDRYWRGYDDSVLGAGQTQWLLDALESTPATFRVLVLGSQWTADGSNDSWAAFLPARDAIFEAIRAADLGGVVTLSGDIHRSELRLLDTVATAGYDIPELTSSPLANNNSSCANDEELLACEDDGDFYILVDVDTTVGDPSLTASLRNVTGLELASMTVYRSQLQAP